MNWCITRCVDTEFICFGFLTNEQLMSNQRINSLICGVIQHILKKRMNRVFMNMCHQCGIFICGFDYIVPAIHHGYNDFRHLKQCSKCKHGYCRDDNLTQTMSRYHHHDDISEALKQYRSYYFLLKKMHCKIHNINDECVREQRMNYLHKYMLDNYCDSMLPFIIESTHDTLKRKRIKEALYPCKRIKRV
jgi:hypothetical protein